MLRIGRRLTLAGLLGSAARVRAAEVSAEGLPRGVYGPRDITFGSTALLFGALGNYFVRGMAGVTRMTISGPGKDAVYTGEGGTIFAGGPLWAMPPGKKVNFTVTFDNSLSGGTDTLSLPVTITAVDSRAHTVINSGCTVTDAQTPPGDASTPHQIRFVAGAAAYGPNADWHKIKIGGPDAALVSLYTFGSLQTTEGAWPLSAHYGEHHITFQAGDEPPVPFTFYILKEGMPKLDFVRGEQAYDNSPVGTVVGTAHASNDLGSFAFSVQGGGGDFIADTRTGQLFVARALTGRANGTENVTLRAQSGTSFADITVPVPILAGTTLPSSAMTAHFSDQLHNAMSIGPVGTVTVRGMKNPKFFIDVENDSCQLLTAYPDNHPIPRYAIRTEPGSADGATAQIAFNHLSAQTDRLVITAVAGPVRCTATFPLTIATKIGPTKTIGPGGDFASVNAAMDAAWRDPAAYAGAIFLLADMDYSKDFNRHEIGHGSEQQNWPCPVTLRGADPNRLTVIDMHGSTSGVGKGLIMQVIWDLTVENLEVRHVSNANWTGRPNAAAFYKEQQTPGNFTIRGCYVHDCDNGILGGDAATHFVVSDTVIAMCGAADYGYCHNAYFGAAASVTASNLLSFATACVHAFKSRAYRTTITDSALLDGENGGASSMLDTPNGGVVHVSNTIFQKGSNPQDDCNTIQYGAEGVDKPVSSALYERNIFINTLPNGNSFGDAVGIANSGSINPFFATTNSVVFRNNVFYNFEPGRRTLAAYHGSGPAIDGGGNRDAPAWPVDLDPATVVKLPAPVVAALRAHPPGPGFTNSAKPDFSQPRLLLRPLSLQARVAADAPPGTVVDTATGYGRDGAAVRDPDYHLTNSANGKYAINPKTGEITVAAPLTDGLDYITVSTRGLDGTNKQIELTSIFFVVVGRGQAA